MLYMFSRFFIVLHCVLRYDAKVWLLIGIYIHLLNSRYYIKKSFFFEVKQHATSQFFCFFHSITTFRSICRHVIDFYTFFSYRRILVPILGGLQKSIPQRRGLLLIALKVPGHPGVEGQSLAQPGHHALLRHLSLHDVGEDEVLLEPLHGVLLAHPVQRLVHPVPGKPLVVLVEVDRVEQQAEAGGAGHVYPVDAPGLLHGGEAGVASDDRHAQPDHFANLMQHEALTLHSNHAPLQTVPLKRSSRLELHNVALTRRLQGQLAAGVVVEVVDPEVVLEHLVDVGDGVGAAAPGLRDDVRDGAEREGGGEIEVGPGVGLLLAVEVLPDPDHVLQPDVGRQEAVDPGHGVRLLQHLAAHHHPQRAHALVRATGAREERLGGRVLPQRVDLPGLGERGQQLGLDGLQLPDIVALHPVIILPRE